jgi:hypothetical protein
MRPRLSTLVRLTVGGLGLAGCSSTAALHEPGAADAAVPMDLPGDSVQRGAPDATGSGGTIGKVDADAPADGDGAAMDAGLEAPPFYACDVGCPDGPCPTHLTPPTVVAVGAATEQIVATAISAGALLYGTVDRDFEVAGQLREVSLATGVSSQLVAQQQVTGIWLDADGTIYYARAEIHSTAMRLFSITASGAPVVIFSWDYPVTGFKPGPQEIWVEVSNPGGGYIIDQGQDFYENLQTLMGPPHGLAFGAEAYFWASGDGPSTIAYAPFDSPRLDTGNTLASADDILADPVVDGEDVYFVHQHAAGECKGALMVVPTTGGPAAPVSLGRSGSDVSSYAVDADGVYWTTPDSGGFVFRADKNGSTPIAIATNQPNARALVTDATHVYWVAAGAHGDEVRSVAK